MERHSGCSRGPGSATEIIVVIHFLYVYMYLCVSVQPLGHGVGWVCIRRSEDVKIFLSFLLRVDLD